MDKRGLSDVITNVLIILLVLIAIGIIASFVIPLLRNTENQVNQAGSCIDTQVDVSRCSVKLNGTGGYDMEVLVSRGSGSVGLSKLQIIYEDSSGKTTSNEANLSINPLGEFGVSLYKLSNASNKPVKARVAFVLEGRQNLCPASSTVECIFNDNSQQNGNQQNINTAPPYVLPSGAVSYFALNESGGLAAWDSVNLGGRADLLGLSFSTNSIPGKAKSTGLRFPGTINTYAQLSSNRLPIGGNPRTIMAWINHTGSGGAIYQFYSSSGQDFTLNMADDGFGGYSLFSDETNRPQNDIYLTASEAPLKNQWNHIAFVIKSSTAWEYYLNGVLVKSGTFQVPLNTGTWTVSRFGNRIGSNFYYKGDIDEFITFNRALNPNEIRNIYDASK